MKPLFKLIWELVNGKKFWGEVRIGIQAGNVTHFYANETKNVEPFKQGWERLPEGLE